ncbi:hypothetical protein [Staphylococcus aureus]
MFQSNGLLRPQAYIDLSLIHISEPTRHAQISYAVVCLKKMSLIHISEPTRH